MRKFKIDKEKAVGLAKEFGLEVSFDSSDKGVFLNSDSEVKKFSLDDFFPELKNFTCDLITKEETVLENLNIKVIKVETKNVSGKKVYKQAFNGAA